MAETTTITRPEIATQLQPYVSTALQQSQDLYEAQVTAGYQSFGEPQVAGVSPQLSQAIQAQIGSFVPNQATLGVEGGLAGLTNQLQQQAAEMTQAGAAGFDKDIMDSYMNPYQQGVTDVAIRKAREESQRQQMMGDSAAAKAGAFGGNRRFLLEGMRGADLLETVGDLQAKGSAQAFDKAITAMENQRRRELTGGRQLSSIGQTRVEGIGKALESSEKAAGRQRALEQELLDDRVREFEAQRDFKGNTLDDYIRRVGGSTPSAAGWGKRQTAQPRYSGLEKFTGYASGIGNFLGGLGKFLGFNEGGPVREGFDEEIGQEGGLTAIAGPAVRFDNGGGTTEEMLKKRRALQGGWGNNPAFTITTLRRNKADINRKIDDMKELINNAEPSSPKVVELKKRLAALEAEKEKYIDAGITTSREDKLRRIKEAEEKKRKEAQDKKRKELNDAEAKRLAGIKIQNQQDEAKKRQAEKYKAYKDKLERENKYNNFFGLMESIRQLPLSVKSDPAAIQKLSKQKDVMDAEDFEKYGSDENRKRLLQMANIKSKVASAGSAGDKRKAALIKAIQKNHQILVEAWHNNPVNTGKEMPEQVRQRLMNQAARSTGQSLKTAHTLSPLNKYVYGK